MITKQELEELASHMLKDTWFLSLYLNVDPKDNPKNEWLLHFKNLARDTLAKAKTAVRKQVKADLDDIERFLVDQHEGLKRGLVVISARKADFWRVYHTAFPFINQLEIDRDPYIKPLMTLLDLYQRYLVVDVAGTSAQLFIAGPGEIEEITKISRPVSPGDRTRDGSTGDMGKVRARRQKENVQRLLFKDLELLIERLLREEDVERILLCGTDSARKRFRETLSDSLKEKVVGDFAVDRNAGISEVLERCLPVMKEVEHRFERKALAELFDQTGGRMGSVLGLSDVLTTLQQGNVRKLYVMSNMVVPGMVCGNCGALTPERDRPCPYCDGEMTPVDYMLDLAIQRAIDQGARVDMIEKSDELTRAGGIGALLRY